MASAKTKGMILQDILTENKGVRLDTLRKKYKDFDDLVYHEIRAYNERLRYHKIDKPRLSKTDYNKALHSGLNRQDFNKKYLSKFESHYKQSPKKTPIRERVKVNIPKQAQEEFKRAYTDDYGLTYNNLILEYAKAVDKYNTLVKGKDKIKLSESWDKLDYDFKKMEAETRRLRAIAEDPTQIKVDGEKVWKSDIDTFKVYEDRSNEEKESELKDALIKLLRKTNPSLIPEVYNMTYDDMYKMYSDLGKKEYEDEDTAFKYPEYYKKEFTSEDEIKKILKDSKDGKAILRQVDSIKDFETNTYINNFMRGLKRDIGEGFGYTRQDLKSIQDILDLIPYQHLDDVLLDDRLEMGLWYHSEEDSFSDSKGEYIKDKLKEVVLERINYWYLDDKQRDYIISELKKY